MKLYYKLMILVSIVVMVVVGFISIVNRFQTEASLETQMGHAASDMAAAIAHIPGIEQKLASGEEDGAIQATIELLRSETRYQYIIVMDMEGIQYSYPYTSGLYKPYKNGGETRVLTSGEAYISADTNQLISAIRSFHPITYEGAQVGAVLVGLLTDQIYEENEEYGRNMETALVLGVVIGVICAFYLARNIKKAIYGLEPKEIAILLSERELIFQSIERGIIAVDPMGEILLCNSQAKLLLGIKPSDEHKSISLTSELMQKQVMAAMSCQCNSANSTIVLENKVTVLMSLCLMHDSNNQVLGAVISLEDLTQVRALAEEITDYRSLVDTLRAQNHEFMNKMQTISGLMQLESYEEAIDYIELLTKNNQKLHHLLTEAIRDNKIAGLLLTKYADYSEKKIDFTIASDSSLTALPSSLSSDVACSIIGNLLENSVEALATSNIKELSIYVEGDENHFNIEIHNSGPAITVDKETLFKTGFSTKGDHRGYGLSLIEELVLNAGGTIYWENDEGVKWYVSIG